MRKFLKIAGISFLTLLILLLVLPFLFKGKIIQVVKEEVNKNLNAKVNFSDDIGLGIFRQFPKLTLTLKELSIEGVDSFKNDTLAYLPELSVSLNLMSVIGGDQMEIHSIRLQKPQIHLWVLKNGQANWDIAKPDSTVSDEDSVSSFKMALELLEITEGHLIYDDQTLPFYTELKNFNHRLKGNFTLNRFLMETQTSAEGLTLGYGGITYISNAKTELKANLDMDMEAMKFTFKDNDIQLNDLHLGGEGFVDMNENDMDFDLVFNAKQTDFKTLMSLVPGVYSESFSNVKASGKVALSGYFKGKMTDALMPGYGLKLDVDKGYFQYPDLPKSLNQVYINLEVDNKTGNTDHTIIDLKRFDAVVANQPISAKLYMATPLSNPYTKGELKGNIDLKEFRSMLPLEPATELGGMIKSDLKFNGYVNQIQSGNTEKFDASGSFIAENLRYKDPVTLPQGLNLDGKLNFNPKTVQLEKCVGRVGMSDFDANGEIHNLFAYLMKDDLLKGQFTFNSNYFNVNEFLSEEETVKKEPSSADSIPLQAFEVPSNLDFVFNSKINTMIYDNLKLTDLGGKIIIRESQMFFENLGVKMLGGEMNLNGVYESSNPKFPFSNVKFDVKSLDIMETFNTFDMVKQLMPMAKYTKGLFNAKINLANNFNQDLSVSYPTVSGDIQMGIGEATVQNLPILNILADKLKIEKLRHLNVKDLNFKLNILNGKVGLDSLLLPLWTGAKARISGYTALDQSIQYIARLSIPRKDFGEANTALNNLTNQAKQKGLNINLSEMVDVDVLIGGFFNKPDVKVSLHDAKNSLVNGVKDQLKDEAEKRKQAALDEAKRKADAAKQKTLDSLNQIKQQGIDKLNAEKKAAEEKAAEEKRKLEEKAKQEADKAKQELEKKKEEEKKKLLDKLKKG